jgi:hypothetical protein
MGIIRLRLGRAKREAIDMAMGKAESWTTKILNGESGVRLDDLPKFLDALDLKAVDKTRVCVNADLAHAIETIARRAIAERGLLFEEDAE